MSWIQTHGLLLQLWHVYWGLKETGANRQADDLREVILSITEYVKTDKEQQLRTKLLASFWIAS